MPYEVAEQVLRATANAMTKSTSAVSNQAEQFGAFATSHAKIVGSAVEANAVELVISAAIGGIAISYLAVSSQMSALANKRLSFDKERIAGIATFTLPTNKLEKDYYTEERVVKDFIDLANHESNAAFATYFGIRHAVLENNKDVDFYSVLPFYRLSEQVDQPVASLDLLDQERKNIRLFFVSALPDIIADLDHEFQMGNKVFEFFKSTFEQSDYLNDLAAPRFIMISLSNLLWNLQHPVDANGFPLNINDCIDLCDQVDTYLNELLRAGAPDIARINNDTNQLLSFVRKLKTHNAGLKRAYVDKQAHDLNLEDIANSVHRSLRIMDTNIYKLIYKRHNPVTGKDKPDARAAEDMAYRIGYINDLVIEAPGLLRAFDRMDTLMPAGVRVNKQAINVMDVLIIFCHLPRVEKNKLFTRINAIPVSLAVELTQTLTKFDQKFIHPVKKITQATLKGKNWQSPDKLSVASEVASRLLPLITLVIEDFRIIVDSPAGLAAVHSSSLVVGGIRVFGGVEQVRAINQEAAGSAEHYKWDLPFLLQLDAPTAQQLSSLPKQQYRMTQISQLLDNLSELIQSYRGFLLNIKFQQFVQDCLDKVGKEYRVLLDNIKQIDKAIPHDNLMRVNLSSIIGPMTRQLEVSALAFSIASKHSEQVLKLPDFTEQEQAEVGQKVTYIHLQYGVLFAGDSGIRDLINARETMLSPINPLVPDKTVNTSVVLALRDLVLRCRNSLSWASQRGHKGLLLDHLLMDINDQPNFTDDQIKQVIMRLMLVTASYRKTIFGQAEYGCTRSAQALIAAVQDKKLNKILPLASIIFDSVIDLDINRLDPADIHSRLKILHSTYKWPESALEIAAGFVL